MDNRHAAKRVPEQHFLVRIDRHDIAHQRLHLPFDDLQQVIEPAGIAIAQRRQPHRIQRIEIGPGSDRS